jgi:hypothetical protein
MGPDGVKGLMGGGDGLPLCPSKPGPVEYSEGVGGAA